jgi:hypothetical protein
VGLADARRARAGAVPELHAAVRHLLHDRKGGPREAGRGRVHRARSSARAFRSRDREAAKAGVGRGEPRCRGGAHLRPSAARPDAYADRADRQRCRARRRVLARRRVFL